jgi:two-component system response regulator AtoC
MLTPNCSSTIVVVENDTRASAPVQSALEKLGYHVEAARDGDELLTRVAASPRPSAVMLDMASAYSDALVTLKRIRLLDCVLPVIMIADAPATLDVVMAMKNGATDFLTTPTPAACDELEKSLNRALQNRPAQAPALRPSTTGSISGPFASTNPRMREIEALAEEIGWSETPVLIQGETGTGKEVLARRLHAASPRGAKPFLKLNCAALPSELVESELFGYERGAFTGAFQRKPGMFELADGGTLLLDEIGDMDVRLQAKLLQVLQDSEFRRIGGKNVRVDVRILAATHRNLEEAIEQGTFREDLYYRLNVVTLELPPLRERPEDILDLAVYFLGKHAIPGRPVPELSSDLCEVLVKHPWPGNIRELENAMRKLVVLRDPGLLARDLRERVVRRTLAEGARIPPATASTSGGSTLTTLDEVSKSRREAESAAIVQALDSTRWNRKRAAELLQIDYKALLYKMKKLGLDERDVEAAAHGS